MTDEQTYHGEVKWFNIERGYGFIRLDNEEELFVHYKDLVQEGFKKLTEGQAVSCTIYHTERGPQAGNVTLQASEDQNNAQEQTITEKSDSEMSEA